MAEKDEKKKEWKTMKENQMKHTLEGNDHEGQG